MENLIPEHTSFKKWNIKPHKYIFRHSHQSFRACNRDWEQEARHSISHGYVKFIYTPNDNINKKKALRNGELFSFFPTQRDFLKEKINYSKMTNYSTASLPSKKETFMQWQFFPTSL